MNESVYVFDQFRLVFDLKFVGVTYLDDGWTDLLLKDEFCKTEIQEAISNCLSKSMFMSTQQPARFGLKVWI